ncbi:MAG UNVERIFIED_CONTAM: hypothetical protein LVR18_34300 [Planctomycetaceae bacterium]|jgi:hypothetical protein
MLMAIPAASDRGVDALLVDCTPCSVFKILGRRFLNASSNTIVQKLLSRLFDNRQPNTYRLYQSTMATRFMKPCAIGT